MDASEVNSLKDILRLLHLKIYKSSTNLPTHILSNHLYMPRKCSLFLSRRGFFLHFDDVADAFKMWHKWRLIRGKKVIKSRTDNLFLWVLSVFWKICNQTAIRHAPDPTFCDTTWRSLRKGRPGQPFWISYRRSIWSPVWQIFNCFLGSLCRSEYHFDSLNSKANYSISNYSATNSLLCSNIIFCESIVTFYFICIM